MSSIDECVTAFERFELLGTREEIEQAKLVCISLESFMTLMLEWNGGSLSLREIEAVRVIWETN
jgi:hypothetical protein